MVDIVTIPLKQGDIRIPLIAMSGKEAGPHIVITAGMDGDEYASIEAAYRLEGRYKGKLIKGSLTILPVVNIRGFRDYRSYNPLDGKYPKLVYPGSIKGTDTDQLIEWVRRNYIDECHVWIDLHGGALTECLDPYLYLYETGRKEHDKVLEEIIRSVNVARIVYRFKGAWKKVQMLSKKKIAYIFAEAGYAGDRSDTWVNTHSEIVDTICAVYGLIEGKILRSFSKRIYRKTSEYITKRPGLWYPKIGSQDRVKKGTLMGEVKSIDQRTLATLKAGEDGEVLWYSRSFPCKEGDLLCEIAHGKMD